MGDSHKLMPLDSSLFNYLIEEIAMDVVSTTGRSKEMRYSKVTPDSAWRKIVEVWEKSPKEFRVIQDVDRFATADEIIINEEGAYVDKFGVRHGHRKATQRLAQSGEIAIDNNGILTEDTELAMRELEQRWNTEIGVKVASVNIFSPFLFISSLYHLYKVFGCNSFS